MLLRGLRTQWSEGLPLVGTQDSTGHVMEPGEPGVQGSPGSAGSKAGGSTI
jgi:hypothetical protein